MAQQPLFILKLAGTLLTRRCAYKWSRVLVIGLLALLIVTSVQAQTGDISLSLTWSSVETDHTKSVAWGDVDGDGDLDLVTGNVGEPNRLYRNDRGKLTTNAVWSSAEWNWTTSIAWGDVDGDGDLDLAVANGEFLGQPNRLYRNNGGVLTTSAVWSSAEWDFTQSIAWGDVDGDSDLDLAVGNGNGQPNRLYRNDGGVLTTSAVWSSVETDSTSSVAWGDVDGDSDLDLAVGNGNGQPNRLYRNDGGVLTSTAAWSSAEADDTTSVAWGDVDGDGDLDLAVGNTSFGSTAGQPNRLYRNDGGVLTTSAIWSSVEADLTQSIAWGDVDGDGDLDLAVGNGGGSPQPNRIYLNNGRMLSDRAGWSSVEADLTQSIAWGDVDGDGDLDLAVGNGDYIGQPNRLYRNNGGVLTTSAVWSSTETSWTTSVAWGDVDGDGDLDLAVGNDGPNQLYRNDSGVLTSNAVWSSAEADLTESIAWGDVDGDGDLDLAVGNSANGNGGQQNRVYRNDSGVLTTSAAWSSAEADDTSMVAWGDVDGDGDLDLAVGNWAVGNLGGVGKPNRLYRNDGGVLTTSAAWSTAEADIAESIAWGDVDGDGDPDLATGSSFGQPNRLYRNDGGVLTTSAVWSSSENTGDGTGSIAWGDVDGDGDPDLGTGHYNQVNRLYRNDGGVLTATAVWSTVETDDTSSIAWGDVDGDGDLDLAVGNSSGHNILYRNDGGVLTATAVWSTVETDDTSSIAWGDVDGDGDLDLAVGNLRQPNRVYYNSRSMLALHGATPIANLHLPAKYGGADFYASGGVWSTSTLPVTYQLFHPQSVSAGRVLGYYSLDGGDHWLPAAPTGDTDTTDLASAPYPIAGAGNSHVYNWNIAASGVMGQSDNVVFRLVVYPSLRPRSNAIPGPFLHGSYATQTFPFRVRGTQVQAMDAATNPPKPLPQALVYRLTSGQVRNAQPYADHTGQLYHTNGQGYLQGRGELKVGDGLAALYPVSPTEWLSFTQSVDYYLTSAAPTSQTLALQPVVTPSLQALNSVQVLTVTADNKLLLVNLDVALEWDARKDVQFMEGLKFNLQRTSDLLFDWTNGQAALGQVRIFQDAKRYPAGGSNPWEDSHIRIYASNRVRPNAAVGGIISPTLVLTETVNINGQNKEIEYDAGQVHMGAIWNRYGETSGNLGDDWARALAHELGHYVFFLEDNYLGLDENGLLVTVKADGVDGCPGVMNDPYRDDQSEFHPFTGWDSPGCQNTLSQRSTGRSDWQSIEKFYHLNQPSESFSGMNQGPALMPLAVTQLQVISPTEAVDTLDVPIFTLLRGASEGGGTYLPSANAQAFLFQGEWLTDLGQPTLDQLQAWGARTSKGDRLCLLEPGLGYYGCEQVQSGDAQLVVEKQPVWQPEIVVSSVNSYTIAISGTVPMEAGSQLCGRLYPVDEVAQPGELVAGATGAYAHTFAATTLPTLEGYVHVWTAPTGSSCAADPSGAASLETVTSYAVGGNPIHRRARRTFSRGGGVHRRARRVPVISADGQVMIFGDVLDAANDEEEWSFTLQALPTTQGLPPGRTLVGQAYRLTASSGAPDLTGTSISFGYLGEQVPPGEEGFLRVYFWQQDAGVCLQLALVAPCWQPLDTFRDTEYNVASAKTQGVGLYALMASLEIPLAGPGWNNFAYPVPYTQTVPSALASLDGHYTIVWGYNPNLPPDERWQSFSPKVVGTHYESLVNDLHELDFGRGYWVWLKDTITLYLSSTQAVQSISAARAGDVGGVEQPPAVYYGTVLGSTDFTPTGGMAITAWIGDRLCGRGQTQRVEGTVVYALDVLADLGDANSGCGAVGRAVTFRVGDVPMATQSGWDNTDAQNLPLAAQYSHRILLSWIALDVPGSAGPPTIPPLGSTLLPQVYIPMATR